MDSDETLPVAVLGATGVIGQKALRLRLLDGHPRFHVAEVAAAPRGAAAAVTVVSSAVDRRHCLW